MPKFRTAYDAPELMPSPVGEPIYKWEYLTDDGEIIEDTRDVYQMIQSAKPMTLYKELIEEYGLDSDIIRGCGDAIYGDTTQFGGTVDDYGNRINSLIADLEQAVAAAKQGQTAVKAGVQGEEDTAKACQTESKQEVK